MTNEEALKGFEDYCFKCTENCLQAGATLACCDCKVNIAINAIKKQIPKKPYGGKYIIFVCPTCYADVELIFPDPDGSGYSKHYLTNYCTKCGQEIDWGGTQ